MKTSNMRYDQIWIESDSSLAVNAIKGDAENVLEMGEVIKDCKHELNSMPTVDVRFVCKNANRVAHEIARIPCLANCYNFYMSPHMCVSEAFMFDISG